MRTGQQGTGYAGGAGSRADGLVHVVDHAVGDNQQNRVVLRNTHANPEQTKRKDNQSTSSEKTGVDGRLAMRPRPSAPWTHLQTLPVGLRRHRRGRADDLGEVGGTAQLDLMVETQRRQTVVGARSECSSPTTVAQSSQRHDAAKSATEHNITQTGCSKGNGRTRAAAITQ